jgi:hypothetical protein
MRDVSRTTIAKRREDLLIVGSQIYERTRNEYRSDVARTVTHIQRALGMQLLIHVAEALLESKSRGIAQQTLSAQIMRG